MLLWSGQKWTRVLAPQQMHAHKQSRGASCSEVVFYQDHVGHLEPINTTPKVQTLDQRSSLHTIAFTMGGNTESDWSPASCQHRSNLLDTAADKLETWAWFGCAIFLKKPDVFWESLVLMWAHLLTWKVFNDRSTFKLYKDIKIIKI